MVKKKSEVKVEPAELIKSKNLFVVREYEYRGIKVLVELDKVNGTASLVEKDGSKYKNKRWLFAGRTVDYMNGWDAILEAMKLAIGDAKQELEDDQASRHAEAYGMVEEIIDHDMMRKSMHPNCKPDARLHNNKNCDPIRGCLHDNLYRRA